MEDGPVNSTTVAHMVKAMDPRSELGLQLLDETSIEGLKTISRGTAILLLIVYIAYLIFQVRLFARRTTLGKTRALTSPFCPPTAEDSRVLIRCRGD